MAINYNLQDKFLGLFFSGPFAPNFYLTGGTALARFYLHHRESVDLDLFTNDKTIDFSALDLHVKNLIFSLKLKSTKEVITDTFLQYFLENDLGQILKVDFVKDIPIHYLITESGLGFDRLCQDAKQKDLGFSEFYLANALDRLNEVITYPVLLKPLDTSKMSLFYHNLATSLLLKIKPSDSG